MQFGSFAGGFTQGYQGAQANRLQKQQMELRQQAAQQQQELEEFKQTGTELKRFSEIFRDMPDDRVPGAVAMVIDSFEQRSGEKLPSSVKARVKEDPEQFAKIMMDTYAQAGGRISQSKLQKMLNPAALLEIEDAFNKRTKAKEAQKEMGAAFGQTVEQIPGQAAVPAVAATPESYSGENFNAGYAAPGSPAVPAVPASTRTTQATVNPYDVNSLLAADARATKGLAFLGANPDVPGRNESSDMLTKEKESNRKQLEFAMSNPRAFAMAQLGFTGNKLTPADMARVERQATANAAALKQAETTGVFKGGGIDKEVAAQQGLSGLETMEEGRAKLGLGDRSGKPAAALPSTSDLANLATKRTDTQERRASYRKDSASALKMDEGGLAQMSSLWANAPPETGVTAGFAQRVAQIVQGVTGQKIDTVAPREILQKSADAMSFSFLGLIGGNDSNSDRTFARDVINSLPASNATNKVLVEWHGIANKRVRDREVLHNAYIKDCGEDSIRCDFDFATYYDKWKDTHPLQPQYEAVLKKHKVAPEKPKEGSW